MAFGWEDVTLARTHGDADVFRLAGFLGDDDLISHLRARLEDSIRLCANKNI